MREPTTSAVTTTTRGRRGEAGEGVVTMGVP
jgi:hypothetical protein